MKLQSRPAFIKGMKNGLPLGLGYFAVAISIGISAQQAGLSIVQGVAMSFLNNASAGQFLGISAIKSSAALLEFIMLMIVTNARYVLMSTALSQRIERNLAIPHRMLLGFDITDELFGISITQPYPLNPFFVYGAYVTTIPMWASGTAIGLVLGNLLSQNLVCALKVSIYGMFIAVIIPQGRTDRRILIAIFASFIISTALYFSPVAGHLSESFRVIILTLVISVAAAIFKPIYEDNKEDL